MTCFYLENGGFGEIERAGTDAYKLCVSTETGEYRGGAHEWFLKGS